LDQRALSSRKDAGEKVRCLEALMEKRMNAFKLKKAASGPYKLNLRSRKLEGQHKT
jgi:hypothetical protein